MINKMIKTTTTAALLAAGMSSTVLAADVTIAAQGGGFQDGQRIAIWEPTAKKLGMTFAEDTLSNWGEVRAQVEAGSITWDILGMGMSDVLQAAQAGVLLKLPEDIVPREDFAPGSVTDHCVGLISFSTIIGYDPAVFGDSGPQTMVDFWDVEKFPGKRGMKRGAEYNFEAAVLAMGHTRDEVYDILRTEDGREAALAKLAEIKPHVIWWESGAQSAQMVKDGEVPLIYAWNGRIQGAIDDGAEYTYHFNDGVYNVDCYAITKGSPNEENAIKFLSEMMSNPSYSAELPKYISYGSVNLKAYETYDNDTLARLGSSPLNVEVQYSGDPSFWLEYGAELSEAFDDMLLSD